MNWEGIGEELAEVLKPVFKPESEMRLFKSIMSILYHQSTDIDDAERIVMSIYDNLPNHGAKRSDVFKLLDKLFIGDVKANTGLHSLEKIITNDFNGTVAAKATKRVKQLIVPEREFSNTYATSNNSWIEIDSFMNKVNYKSISSVKNEQIENTLPVLLCRPYKVQINEDPLKEGKREFTIVWKTTNNSYFTTRDVGLNDIKVQLQDSGYVLNGRYVDAAITGAIQIFQDNGIAEIQNEIQADGFYYSQKMNKLVSVGYEITPAKKMQVKSALKVIEDLALFFKGHEDKLATSIKHGLQVPFGFAKKQMGLPLEFLIPYMYHFGKSGSGKTTIARIALWFYGRPSVDENDIGGTEFDTVPRIGEQLKKSTFGIIVNEPETSLSKKSCAATLKTTVERTNSRQKIRGNRMEHILALSTVIFASNVPLPNHEGLPRRFVQILYNYSEKKNDSEKKEFMNKFKIGDPDECEFNKLQHLGNFTANMIQNDISLLRGNWKVLGNSIIKEAYKFADMKVPEWLLQYTESVTDEDIDDEEVENIRMFLLEQINSKSGQVKVYSAEDGRMLPQDLLYTEDSKNPLDFEEKVWNVINEGLISFMFTHQTRDGIKEICFTKGMKKIFNENDINCFSISSTAELLGWDYGIANVGGKSSRCMKVKFTKFMNFLYPQMEGFDEY